jgi:hypothetical protein
LEKLTLFLRIASQHAFTNPIDLLLQFTMHMSQLNSFNFYLSVENNISDLIRYLSENDVKQYYKAIQFNALLFVGNTFPNIVFNYVLQLWVLDVVPLEQEFFQQVSKAFPLLEYFHITVVGPSVWADEQSFSDVESQEIVKYSYLTLLDA